MRITLQRILKLQRKKVKWEEVHQEEGERTDDFYCNKIQITLQSISLIMTAEVIRKALWKEILLKVK